MSLWCPIFFFPSCWLAFTVCHGTANVLEIMYPSPVQSISTVRSHACFKLIVDHGFSCWMKPGRSHENPPETAEFFSSIWKTVYSFQVEYTCFLEMVRDGLWGTFSRLVGVFQISTIAYINPAILKRQCAERIQLTSYSFTWFGYSLLFWTIHAGDQHGAYFKALNKKSI